MKVEDLMLGDWVQVEGIPLRVGGLSNYDIYVDLFRGNESEVYSQIWADEMDSIQPIPITPEILEKNGFEKCDEDTDGAIMYEIGNMYLGISVWVNTEPCLLGGWRTWATPKESYSMMEEIPIHYVHELQHALRLCGIEKTIEL